MTLAQQHRQQQLSLRAQTVKDILRLWPAFDLSDIDGSWSTLEPALLLLVKHRGRQSNVLARRYYEKERKEARVRGTATPRLATIPDDQVIAGLQVVGPIQAKRSLALKRPEQAIVKNALVSVSGVVTREVLNHGRKTIGESLATDRKQNRVRVGYSRVTSGSPCSFCASLVGQVFYSEDFACHAHCSCSNEIVYL